MGPMCEINTRDFIGMLAIFGSVILMAFGSGEMALLWLLHVLA
jgi:hypothetical protein